MSPAALDRASSAPAFNTGSVLSDSPSVRLHNGDKKANAGETCDDGNTDDSDGCSSTCQSEPATTPTPGQNCEYLTLDPEDETVALAGASSPPPEFLSCSADPFGDQSLGAANLYDPGNEGSPYMNFETLLRWDTSVVATNQIVSRAWLQVHVLDRAADVGKGLDADWYNWGPECESTDYDPNGPANALSVTGTCGIHCMFANVVPGSEGHPGDQLFEVDGAAQYIDTTGSTYLRLHVNDSTTTGTDGMQMASSATAFAGPRLVLKVCDTPPTCGNGVIETGETCDDSNTTDGDCCSSTCQTESGGGCE